MGEASDAVFGQRFVGRRMPRKEDARLLTGRGVFVDDVSLPGTLHVAFHRSPIARGRIVSIDTAAAKALPGVVAVYTIEDLSAVPLEMVSFFMIVPPPGTRVRPLADGRVAFVGDPIVMVIAESRYVAEDAASLVTVIYEEEAAVVGIDAARAKPPIHPDLQNNVSVATGALDADPELAAVFARAAHVVTGTVCHQRIAQSPMETRGIVMSTQGDNELVIYLSCASPHVAARQIALALGLSPANIRVIARDVGGSFGQKTQVWREEFAVIVAGLILRRPIKWIEDRFEHMLGANQAREQECMLKLAFDEDARLLGAQMHYLNDNGAYPHYPDQTLGVAMFMWGAYRLPRFEYLLQGLHTNTVGLGGYRGPWAIETLARETVMDLAARQIGIDPIELRRRNLIVAADQPCSSVMGLPITDITPSECLDALLEQIDVPAFRREQAEARKQGRCLGLGIATYIEPTGSSGFSVLRSDVAQLRIEPTGKVTAILSTHSQGHGTQTTNAQVIADHLGVPFEDVTVFEADSAGSGFGPGAAGSRQAITGGGASIKAAEILTDKVKRIAGHVLNASPEDVRIENGMVQVAGVEEMTRSLREIAEIAYNEPDRLPHGMGLGLEALYRFQPPGVTWTSAAHGCVVEVDTETGFVAIKRWLASEDCGVIINPGIVEGQIAGGLAQAIGTVLLEHFVYDEAGNPTSATFKDYLLPAITDVPDFEYFHICTPSQSPGGFRGIGEGGAIIGPPTLVNAIADALAPFGAECLDLPLSPPKILELIEAGSR